MITKRSCRHTPQDAESSFRHPQVRLRVGDIVPADLRLLETSGLECDESVLTGESAAAAKTAAAERRFAARPALLRVHGHGRAQR